MHTSQCHHGRDSVAYARDLDTLAWFTVGTLRELARAIRKLRSALAQRSLLDPESDPWLTLRKLEKRWENDESYRKMRDVGAFHLDEEPVNRGLDALTKDPCVPVANGQGSKHVKSRLTLGFLALHNGLGLDLDGYRRFHEVVMADLAAVPQAIQNAFIDAAKAVGVPFWRRMIPRSPRRRDLAGGRCSGEPVPMGFAECAESCQAPAMAQVVGRPVR